MFKSRYPFEAKFPQSISFAANDTFLGLRKENDHWLYVYHEDGRLGAVPLNYVEEKRLKKTDEIVRIIDAALAALSDKELFDKPAIVNYLEQLKRICSGSPNHSSFPLLPTRKRMQPIPVSRLAPPAKAVEKTTTETKEETKNSAIQEKLHPGLSFIMLDKLRCSTNANYEKCLSGFMKMLTALTEYAPQFAELAENLSSEIINPNPTVKRATYSCLLDWQNLQDHIATLERRAKDQQESSWPLSEDDMTVVSDLDSFAELLCNASVDMVRTCLIDDKLPLALSYLYQCEKRKLVRRFYLLVLVATCHIQPAVWTVYLDSCLPMEIIRELRASQLDELDLILDLRVLTVLLAKSNSLPVNLYNELDAAFFDCIFGRVTGFTKPSEDTTVAVADLLNFSGDSTPVNPNKTNPPNQSFCKAMGDLDLNTVSPGGQMLNGHKATTGDAPSALLVDTFVQFICAANRHFCVPSSGGCATSTPTMAALLNAHDGATIIMVERLLQIFNRGGDPLSLNGVSFVRQLRGSLHDGFDISDSLYSGAALYVEGPVSGATSRRASYNPFNEDHDCTNTATTNGFSSDVDEVSTSSSVVSERRRYHNSIAGAAVPRAAGLTDTTLQTAPDTPRNTARKLLADIFSHPQTAKLVYSNDNNVVVDVIIRQLHDLPANSPHLPEYIFCMDNIVRNSEYMTRINRPYRLDDLIEGLHAVEQVAGNSGVISRDFTTSRSLRLASTLLATLSSFA